MNDLIEGLTKLFVIIYCAVCRLAFEFGSVVMVWFLFSHVWAALITVAFVIWQILGFFVVAWAKE